MSTAPIGGDFTLDARQLQLVRGAVNAALEYIDRFGYPVSERFDSARKPHLLDASDVLGGALEQVATDGEFTGRMTPSEMRATRMAVGLIESFLTEPRSDQLDQLSINPTNGEIRALGEALGGLTAPTTEDVAFSDLRLGIDTTAIERVFPLSNRRTRVVDAANDTDDPSRVNALSRAERALRRARQVDRCQEVPDVYADIAASAVVVDALPPDAKRTGGTTIDEAVVEIHRRGGSECYDEFGATLLRAAGEMLTEALLGDARDARADSLVAAHDLVTMAYWAAHRRRVRRP